MMHQVEHRDRDNQPASQSEQVLTSVGFITAAALQQATVR